MSDQTDSSKEWVPLNKRASLSIFRITGICFSIFGFQTVYTVVFGLLSPIMDSPEINIPQVYRSFIYLIGPVAGFFAQPLVGYYSDGCHAKIGRRRPFMIAGAVGIIIGFILLYFCREIGQGISKSNARGWSIFFLVLSLALDFTFCNIMQASARSVIADLIPKHQLVLGNSIGAVWFGLAQIFSNFIGGFNLAKYTSLNYQQLVIICGIIFIIVSLTVSCICAHEEQFTEQLDRPNPFTSIWNAMKSMSSPMWRMCILFFLSWFSFMEFNNECSSYVGNDLY